MENPKDPTPPDVPSGNRRELLLNVAAVVGGAAIGVGIVYLVKSAPPGTTMAKLALTHSRALGRRVPAAAAATGRATGVGARVGASPDTAGEVVRTVVREHSKMQAVGKNWLEHRPIQISEYVRGGV